MKKINLLVEIPNIRNTIGQNSKTPDLRPRLRSLAPAVALLTLVAGVALWPMFKDNKNAQPRAAVIEKDIENKNVQTTEKIKVAAIAKPQKIDVKKRLPDEKLKPIVSRPVAKDAVVVAKKTVSNDIWTLRFGLCFYKKSCESIQKRLRKMGMPVYIEKTTTNLLAHRVVAGPWTYSSIAEDARGKMKRSGIVSASFSAENKFYLSTDATTKKKQAHILLKKIEKLGHRAKLVSKKEPFEVYKVYGKSYSNPKKAKMAMQNLLFSRVECVLEKRSVQ